MLLQPVANCSPDSNPSTLRRHGIHDSRNPHDLYTHHRTKSITSGSIPPGKNNGVRPGNLDNPLLPAVVPHPGSPSLEPDEPV